MPQLGETVTEGTITRWLKDVGDEVALDDLLFEVSTDKVDTEVPSAHVGFLRQILVPEGDTVPIGTPLAVITATADEELVESPPAPRPAANPASVEAAPAVATPATMPAPERAPARRAAPEHNGNGFLSPGRTGAAGRARAGRRRRRGVGTRRSRHTRRRAGRGRSSGAAAGCGGAGAGERCRRASGGGHGALPAGDTVG